MVSYSSLGPRVLLRRLRDVMAEPGSDQQRLDRIVSLIASNMVAEVCSVYILQSTGELELFATEGLKSSAVHRATLKLGEGLVGVIARDSVVLNLEEAQVHPSFKYLPETGEEIYSSFLGVPILRGGQTIGVLVIQNKARRHYLEEEEEAIQTAAMVLAEVLVSSSFKDVLIKPQQDKKRQQSHRIQADPLVSGIALGHVVLHEPRVVVTQVVAQSVVHEQARLDQAIALLREQVDALISRIDLNDAGEHEQIFEALKMFAYDRGWVRRIRESIETGLTAEAAVERIQNENRLKLQRQHDLYLRERLHDLDDLTNRLLRILTGQTGTAAKSVLPPDTILVARAMGAAELLDYDHLCVKGLVLSEAGANSHVIIVARALNVPTVGHVAHILDFVETGDPIIIDGGVGEVYIRPPVSVEQAYKERVRFYAKKQKKYAQLRDSPAVTLDGYNISLNMNAGLLIDLPHLQESGADGIGLFRTELEFMLASKFPRFSKQERFYRRVLEGAGKKPIVFRSLDIGSDKTVQYLHFPHEDNPALGWRAVRYAMERPALMQLQVRALLRAASGRELRLMFPMIADISEFQAARQLVHTEINRISKTRHLPPSVLKLGAMVEVPSLLWQLDRFLPEVDFVSVGSNDLLQFLFASDRMNPKLSHRYDCLHPSALKALLHIVEKTQKHKVPLTLCGEMAGKPLEAMALVALGFRSLSMSPSAIGPVKAMLLSLSVEKLRGFLIPLLETPKASLRADLLSFAHAYHVTL